jgi:HAD superfamily hydrolase (TIGR01549 family)
LSPVLDAFTFDTAAHIRGVLFDVDGTLYRQWPVRLAMGMELASQAVRSPSQARARVTALARFRTAQERLRREGQRITATAQADIAASGSQLPPTAIGALAQEWMHRRPLKYLRACRARGLVRVLDLLQRRGVATGVLTDYPPLAKLEALGLSGRFSLVLCATDDEVAYFKPHPRGFEVACARWHLSPHQVLMVGDRVDVDAAGAAAAGMPSVIIGARRCRTQPLPYGCVLLPSFERLYDVLAGHS